MYKVLVLVLDLSYATAYSLKSTSTAGSVEVGESSMNLAQKAEALM